MLCLHYVLVSVPYVQCVGVYVYRVFVVVLDAFASIVSDCFHALLMGHVAPFWGSFVIAWFASWRLMVDTSWVILSVFASDVCVCVCVSGRFCVHNLSLCFVMVCGCDFVVLGAWV